MSLTATDRSSLDHQTESEASRPLVLDGASASTLPLPVDASLTGATFAREGHDLVIDGAGDAMIVVRDYFAAAEPADLTT
jgi:hypothetical protein